MARDRHDLEMTGSGEAAAGYDEAVDALLRLRPGVVRHAEKALATDPDCVMARVLLAYAYLGASEIEGAIVARGYLKGAVGGLDRERRHLDAARSWALGDWWGAARVLDGVLEDHPTDVLALSMGHQLDFFLGDAMGLRGRVERALAAWDPRHPQAGFVQGMLAFGLEESGDYLGAERAGRRAVDEHPDDVWAIHAVAHVCEMQGRAADGVAFLDETRAQWSEGNFLAVHTAWHGALFHLEQGDTDGVLAIYDTAVRGPDALGTALELLDATALLWRLHLDGVDVGGRWTDLADAWSAKDPTPWYVFNDLHALMALVAAGRPRDADALVARLEAFAHDGDPVLTNHAMVSGPGLAVARGLVAFGHRAAAGAVAHLGRVRRHLSQFGGSHAQRDVFERTLLVAAAQAGDIPLARRLAQERLDARPSSAWARGWLAELGA